MNSLLSICIPTYNRAELLRGCLENLIPQLKKHKIPIYISDNASTDNTVEIILKYQKIYPHIYYSSNPKNLGPVKNIPYALKMSKSKYSWLFGDKYRLFDGAVDIVLEKLKSVDCDLFVLNAENRVGDITESRFYSDQNELLDNLGWHMTLISCLIWSFDPIKNGKFEKYMGTELMHFGVIFDYFADKKFSVYWLAKPLVYSCFCPYGWLYKVFEVFVKKWFNLVKSLPSSYSEDAKLKCIKDHGLRSELFSFKGILLLRLLGLFNFRAYKEYSFYFKYVTNVPSFALFLISIFPVIPLPAGIIRPLKKVWGFFR